MSSELANTAHAVVAEAQERLAQLAEKAKEAHQAAQDSAATAVERALEAGRALLEARDLCPHGTWIPWLKEHFKQEVGTARSYMRAAKRWHILAARCPNAAQLPLREVLKLLSKLFPHDGGETIPPQTPETPRRLECETAAEPRSVVATSSADDIESVQAVVDCYYRLIEALRYVLQLGRREPTYFQLLLNTLEVAHPDIEDFEESVRSRLRRRRGA